MPDNSQDNEGSNEVNDQANGQNNERPLGAREGEALLDTTAEAENPSDQEIVEANQASNNSTIAPTSVNAPGKSKKLIIAVLAAVLVVVGLALWFFIMRDNSAPANTDESSRTQKVQRFGVAAGLVEGAVEYSIDGGEVWQKLATDTDLSEGDQVRTLGDGRAVLLIDDGSATRLASNSSLELTSLETSSVVITNLSGETYNRVVASSSRKYSVVSDVQTYVAKGTAFRTFNSATKKGVEVFHSTVVVEDKETDVTEGNAFFVLSEQKEKENTVSAIDLTALKKDEFIKWNSEQDKKTAEFANALGVLVELDKPDPAPTPAPQPTAQSGGISLSGSVSEYSANFSWKVSGVDVSKGYKLVKSKTSQSPTYPENSAAYIESGKTSYSLYLGDGRTYYFRICAYRGDSCDSYSNTVTVTTPVKPTEQVQSGAVNLALSGNMASWTFGGTAPYGFKLVGSKTTGPTYDNAEFKKFSEGTSTELPYGLDAGATYYVRVCKYTDGGCVDYSNELTYLAP